jgi:polyisoprenoid-binding protein YceI
MRTTRMFLAAALVLAVLAPAFAAGYKIDAVHTTVLFSVRHIFTDVQGKFQKFDGAIEYDPANQAAASVQFTVDAASIDTNNEKRDGHLRSPDFFDAAKFPTLSFKSTKVVAKGKDMLEVTGDFTMRGVTKSITVPVKVLGVLDSKDFGKKAGFSTSFTINRKDYGITWNKVMDVGGALLGDDVKIEISVEANGV